MSDKQYQFTLTVGDWSRDGHNQFDTFTVVANVSLKEFQTAYKSGTKKLGVDIIESLCCDYEDMSVPEDVVQKFIAAGLNPDDLFIIKDVDVDVDVDEDDEKEYSLENSENWVDIIFAVVKLGNSTIECEVPNNNKNWNVGGYGLFYS